MSNIIGFGAQTIGRRQAVTQGPVDANGLPNAIAATTGLNVQINASPTNAIRCNFADGLLDFPAVYASTQVLALSASTTTFIYLERNTSTNAVTVGTTAIAPVYSVLAPSSPVTGAHWFKVAADSLSTQPGMVMYEWSGTLWIPRQRVFIGEVVSGASSITSTVTYAFDRRYSSAWTAWSGQQTINFAHNLGISFEAGVTWWAVARVNSSDTNASLTMHTINATGLIPFGLGNRLNQPFLTGGAGLYYNGSAYVTAGQLKVFIDSIW